MKSINVVDLKQFIYTDKKTDYISLGKHSYNWVVGESSENSFSSFKS